MYSKQWTYFNSLSDEEICIGLNCVHDSEYFVKIRQTSLHKAAIGSSFILAVKLQDLAFLWLDCHKDRILTRLRYLGES